LSFNKKKKLSKKIYPKKNYPNLVFKKKKKVINMTNNCEFQDNFLIQITTNLKKLREDYENNVRLQYDMYKKSVQNQGGVYRLAIVSNKNNIQRKIGLYQTLERAVTEIENVKTRMVSEFAKENKHSIIFPQFRIEHELQTWDINDMYCFNMPVDESDLRMVCSFAHVTTSVAGGTKRKRDKPINQ
jgi:hypothetical protein